MSKQDWTECQGLQLWECEKCSLFPAGECGGLPVPDEPTRKFPDEMDVSTILLVAGAVILILLLAWWIG